MSPSPMSPSLSRRRFLTTAATTATAIGSGLPGIAWAAQEPQPLRLAVEKRVLEVKGKPAPVFGIRQPNGTSGLFLDPGQRFIVDLANRSGEDTIIHWHGQTPPYVQDGVADKNRPLIANGASQLYDYAPRAGTHWMHSHHGLQEQLLMAAPLVVRRTDDLLADAQEVTVLLHDFTFKDPKEVLAGLTGGAVMNHAAMGHEAPASTSAPAPMDHSTMDHAAMGHGAPAAPAPVDHSKMNHAAMSHGAGGMDLNDVEYDAYLANDRTLDDPQVVAVEKGGRVRLRLINGATSTAFHIDLGPLTGTVVAVDGNPVAPVSGNRFGMAMGQRLDVVVTLPSEGGAFPVLAVREGDRQRTGVILATPGAMVTKMTGLADRATGPIDLSLETRLRAITPLPVRPIDAAFNVRLTGTMMPYVWTLNDEPFGGHKPLQVATGQRVTVTFTNQSMMAHPMHLHGHHFQVVTINGTPLAGAVRDTVLVPVNGSVTVAFDADNPGRWPLHCHNLLHMATGMMTEVVYHPAS